MMFHSPIFILGFLPVCLAGYFALGRFYGGRWPLLWLIAANLVFYGWWDPAYLPLLAGSVLLNHTIASKIRHATRPRLWLIAGVTVNLTILGWFKYTDFLLHIAAPAAPRLIVTLPLAISFFTFQQIMFLIDTARRLGPDGKSDASRSPGFIPYATFITFFPHLIAGPIVRPTEILPQIMAGRVARLNLDNLAEGALIFMLGLSKKCILADMFGGFADIGFAAAAAGAPLTFFEAWYALLSYGLQIYFDFSGYSDMAIGLARMLNVRFPMNFDSPYQACSITEFWRRWHMTLSSFLRDYLYIPLGGNRCGAWRRAVNLMLTMLLAGLWHGAGWNFVLWGGLHGLYLTVHAQYRRLFPPLPAVAGRSLTLLAVILAWVPFRAGTFNETVSIVRGLFGLNGIALPRMIVSALPGLFAIVEPVSVLPSLGDARTLSFPEVSACLLLGWLIVLTMPNIHRMTERARCRTLVASFALSVQGAFFAPHVAPFLYFQF